MSNNYSRDQIVEFAGEPLDSPVKPRTTEPWELVDVMDKDSDNSEQDFNPPSPLKDSNYNSSNSNKSTIRSLASSFKRTWNQKFSPTKSPTKSPSKINNESPSKYKDLVVEMKPDDSSSSSDDDDNDKSWNVVPGECGPTRLSNAASIHHDTITDNTVKLVGSERPPSPSPSFVNRPSLPATIDDNADKDEDKNIKEGSSNDNNNSNININNDNDNNENNDIQQRLYPQLPKPSFVFGSYENAGVSNANFTSIMKELNDRLPTTQIKPEVAESWNNQQSPRKSAAEYGLKSSNLKVKRKFDDAHKAEFDKMDSIASHYSAKQRPKFSPTKLKPTTSTKIPTTQSPNKQQTMPNQPSARLSTNSVVKKPNARVSTTEPTQPRKRIRVQSSVHADNNGDRKEEIKRRLEVSRQRRRSSMATNNRGRPSARKSSVRPPPITKTPNVSRAAGLIKSVGKKLFGGSLTSTTNVNKDTKVDDNNSNSNSNENNQKRVVKKLKKPVPNRTTSLTKPQPFSFSSQTRSKPTIETSNANVGGSRGMAGPPPASEKVSEAQARAQLRLKLAKEGNKSNTNRLPHLSPTKKRTTDIKRDIKRPSNAENVTKARMSTRSPIKKKN